VYLVDEEHVPGLQVGEYGGQVPGTLQRRAGGLAEGDPHLVGDDPGQGGLSQSRRAREEHMVQGLIPLSGGPNEDFQVFAYAVLSYKLAYPTRTQGEVQLPLVLPGFRIQKTLLTRSRVLPIVAVVSHFPHIPTELPYALTFLL
jgi:hypothetical protein